MCKNDDPVVSAVKAPSTDEAMATAGVEHEPEIVKPPASIGWKEALKSGWVYEPKFQFYTREVLLGIIICMAQIPESIAFAYLARVRPPVALHAAWVIGLVCSIFGGRPGMVNGATGAFAAIVATFLDEPTTPGGNGNGVELLFPSVIVAGFLMLGVWALKLDRFMSMLPLPVMIGFCNGLAIVIGAAQLHPFQAPLCVDGANATSAHGSGRRLAAGACTSTGWKQGAELWFMILIMFSAMGIMEFLPKVPKPVVHHEKTEDHEATPLWKKCLAYPAMFVLELPSSMISIIVSIALEFAVIRPAGYHTATIGDVNEFTARDAFPRPFFMEAEYDLSILGTGDAWGRIMYQGLLLCAVGCIESLMTAEVVSDFTKTGHHSGLVVAAMGAGNILSGFLGGMGGNAMIGLSTIACLNGGKGRIAPVATAAGIFICVSAAYTVLNFIPMAALAGIMIVVVLHTFKWFSLPMLLAATLPEKARESASENAGLKATEKVLCCGNNGAFSLKRKVIRSDVIIMVVTTVLVYFTNIVVAVGGGLALSCMAYAWSSAKQIQIRAYTTPDGVKTYEVDGPLFFAASRELQACFSADTDPEKVVVLFSHGVVFDYTLLDSLVALSAVYKAAGKSIEFRRLHSKSVRMLDKASVLTKQVAYQQEVIQDATAGPTRRPIRRSQEPGPGGYSSATAGAPSPDSKV